MRSGRARSVTSCVYGVVMARVNIYLPDDVARRGARRGPERLRPEPVRRRGAVGRIGDVGVAVLPGGSPAVSSDPPAGACKPWTPRVNRHGTSRRENPRNVAELVLDASVVVDLFAGRTTAGVCSTAPPWVIDCWPPRTWTPRCCRDSVACGARGTVTDAAMEDCAAVARATPRRAGRPGAAACRCVAEAVAHQARGRAPRRTGRPPGRDVC